MFLRDFVSSVGILAYSMLWGGTLSLGSVPETGIEVSIVKILTTTGMGGIVVWLAFWELPRRDKLHKESLDNIRADALQQQKDFRDELKANRLVSRRMSAHLQALTLMITSDTGKTPPAIPNFEGDELPDQQ